jgi:hypothetical protein
MRLPQSQNTSVKNMCIIVNPSWDWQHVHVDRPYPPSPITCLVYGENRSPLFRLAGIVAYLNSLLSIALSVTRIVVTWTCDQLDWFSLIIIPFIDTNSPSQEPRGGGVGWLFLLRMSLAYFSIRVLGCQELVPTFNWASLENVALDWPMLTRARLAITRTIWSEWTWSSWFPLALRNMSLKCIVGPLINPGHTLFKEYPRKTVQLCICTFAPRTVYHTYLSTCC